jgi:regulator of RNase E activity RraB
LNIEALTYPETVIFRIIALMAYTVLIYYVISRSYWKYLVGYPMFNDDRDMVGVYMLLADYLPVAGYDDLTTFAFGIEITDEELSSIGQIRKIEHLLRETQKFCYRSQVVFAGYRISMNQETMMLYFYSNASKTETFKNRYYSLLCHYTDEDIIINQEKDSQFLVFKNELFPDDYQLQEMYAQIVYDKCVEEGFDIDEQYGIQYLISMHDDEYLADCINDLRKEGFLVRRTPEEDFYDEELDLYFYTLVIEHQSNIGIERLKYNTKTIINIIARYDGNLENWNVLSE